VNGTSVSAMREYAIDNGDSAMHQTANIPAARPRRERASQPAATIAATPNAATTAIARPGSTPHTRRAPSSAYGNNGGAYTASGSSRAKGPRCCGPAT
jgi:hypothetical protein